MNALWTLKRAFRFSGRISVGKTTGSCALFAHTSLSRSPGARTFLSAATAERSTVLIISPTLSSLHLAADKNVRAPTQLRLRLRCFERFPISLFCALLLGLTNLLFTSGCARSEKRADIVILNGGEPESLDPALITGQLDGRVVLSLFEGLTRFHPVDASPIPAIAERWDLSSDGRVYTFHLRTNAMWSTGEPITAEDVVYSWRRLLDPATAADYAGQLFYLKNGEEFNSGKIKDPNQLGVRALDAHTLRVELNSPTAFFLDLCANHPLAVVPRKTIERYGDRWLKARPLPVSGAYELDAWWIHNKIRLRKNPRYWDAANVRNETVEFLPIESAMTALNMYDTGQADILWDKNLVPTELIDILRQRPDCYGFDYLGTYFLRCNVTRKPLDDPRVRQALALVIDKKRLVERITRAGEKVAAHLTPAGLPHYHAPEGLGYDPNAARQLLSAAGYPGGKGFPIFQYLFDSRELHKQIGIELQGMWQRELGINVELRQLEWKVYLAAQTALDYDLCRGSWIGDYNDPNTFLDIFMSNNGNNRTGWKNSRYDQLVRTANQLTDLEKRAQLLQQAEFILAREELPIIPLYFYAGILFYDAGKIEGIGLNLLDNHPVSAIHRKSGQPTGTTRSVASLAGSKKNPNSETTKKHDLGRKE